MIKGKPPFPFETIALAVSFSPGLSSLVSETKRLCDLHDALAVFIHIGKKTGDKHRELADLLSASGFHDGNSRIHWDQGDVVDCILRICKQEVADVVLVGASDKENFQLPVGQVASEIAKKAKCSVLIFSHAPTGSFKRIVVNSADHKKTDLTILTAVYIAEKENCESLNIIGESNGSDLAETKKEFSQLDNQTGSFVFKKAIDKSDVEIIPVSLSDNQYSSVTEYAFKSGADLLITHSTDHHLLIFDRISQADGIESFLKDIPCNIMVVHPRLPD